MKGIEGYFSPEAMERRRQKDAAALGRIEEENRRRMEKFYAAARREERSAENSLSVKQMGRLLHLHDKGQSSEELAEIYEYPREKLWLLMQCWCFGRVMGLKDRELFYFRPRLDRSLVSLRCIPKPEAIAARMEELSMDLEAVRRKTFFSTRMLQKCLATGGKAKECRTDVCVAIAEALESDVESLYLIAAWSGSCK